MYFISIYSGEIGAVTLFGRRRSRRSGGDWACGAVARVTVYSWLPTRHRVWRAGVVHVAKRWSTRVHSRVVTNYGLWIRITSERAYIYIYIYVYWTIHIKKDQPQGDQPNDTESKITLSKVLNKQKTLVIRDKPMHGRKYQINFYKMQRLRIQSCFKLQRTLSIKQYNYQMQKLSLQAPLCLSSDFSSSS